MNPQKAVMLLNVAGKRATRGLLGGVRDIQAVRLWRGEQVQPSPRKLCLTYTSCCKEGLYSNQKSLCVFLVAWLSSNGSVICRGSQLGIPLLLVYSYRSAENALNLHSLVSCLDHREPDTDCSHAKLCQAAQCIGMHLGAYDHSHGEFSR